MPLLTRIFLRVRRDCCRWLFHRASRRILRTDPVKPGEMALTLLSMVHKRDVLSYLISVKSFVRFARPSRIVVVCDPSIEDVDREILKAHIPHVELRNADEFVHPSIPRGGCWERLYAISEYNPSGYVVQLDADTITTRPIAEVVEAIRTRQGFVLGEIPAQKLLTLAECSARAKGILGANAHVQTRSEAAIAEVGLPMGALYVRGCAGFTGFPAASDMRIKLLDFSERMAGALGDGWRSWGTEQVTSNYLVANASGTRVLPFPKYGTPDQSDADTAFLHFIGSLRFESRDYETAALAAIRELGGGA